MATLSAWGRQLKAIVESADCSAVDESSEWDGAGAPASAPEQVTASCTEYATAVEEQIEQSKRHWSLLSTPSSSSIPDDAAMELDNRAVFHDLLEHPTWGGFFGIFGYDTENWLSSGSLEVGEKFAEGGQAELFHAHVTWKDPKMNVWDVDFGTQWVHYVAPLAIPMAKDTCNRGQKIPNMSSLEKNLDIGSIVK